MLDLVLIGFGNVARRFVTLLEERSGDRQSNAGPLAARVVGICTRRHGSIADDKGVDAVGLAASVRDGRTLPDASGSPLEFIAAAARRHRSAANEGRLVVVETTTLDVRDGEPATTHIRAALDAGAHVITANKGPVAFAYRDLADAAARARRYFRFEGVVMDGIPLFNLARTTLPAVRINGFRGVVNSTTNYILTAMEQGQPFAEALAEMQAMGIAEADPSLDVEGWDAAAKAAALANVLLDARITPRDVEREGIGPATAARAIAAREAGRRLKLVVRVGLGNDGVAARVAPEELPEDDLLAGLEGQQNAVILHTDLLGEIAIVQRGGGLTQTAYALLSDLFSIADARAAGS